MQTFLWRECELKFANLKMLRQMSFESDISVHLIFSLLSIVQEYIVLEFICIVLLLIFSDK